MNLDSKIALGIDICENRIDMVLLKKDGSSFKLLKTASTPVPAGAIEDGNIKDVALLAKAIRNMKNRIALRTVPTAVSLFVNPTIMQVMEIPAQLPGNINKYLQQKMKNFTALLGRKIALDFCSVSQAGLGISHGGRVITVATDKRRVKGLVDTFKKAGIVAGSIEPGLLACTRALYSKNIEGKYDSNVLIAELRDDTLSLCVFKKQDLDFVRTRKISDEVTSPDELCKWIGEQLNTVISSYEIESESTPSEWELSILSSSGRLPEDAEKVLRAIIPNYDIEILTSADCILTVAKQFERDANSGETPRVSLSATGLAIKALNASSYVLNIDLFPVEAAQLRATVKRSLIAANIIAAVLFVMFVVVGLSNWRTSTLYQNTLDKKTRLLEQTHNIAERRISLDGQIRDVSKKLKTVNEILEAHRDIPWPGLLNDVAHKKPKTVCLTGVESITDGRISLKGMAISNEDIYLFVNTLNESENIDSALIYETKKDTRNNGLVSFEVRCTAKLRKKV